MIIARTPVRISFLGGGTDYPDHYLRHGGQTLGVAIDKYSYVTVNRLAPLFDYRIRVGYSRTELVQRPEEIAHPAVRECLRFLGIDGGLEIHYMGDLPARTGLGSSSSFTVALLHALHAFRGDDISREQLAEEAVRVEHEWIRERVGVQDQYTCALGGLLHLAFGTDGRVASRRIELPPGRLALLAEHLLLLYTGIRRHAHEILDEQLERTRSGANDRGLERLAALVSQGVEILEGEREIGAFGELLHDAWEIKRGLSSRIASPLIDDCYARARAAGAVGGKLLGAGGGGFLLLLVPPARQPAVCAALPGLTRAAFSFEPGGSVVLFHQSPAAVSGR